MNRKKGFTLIEIIVVLIILGVLAAIAVPSYYTWINRSTASEAYVYMKSTKDQLSACILSHNSDGTDFSNCVSGVINNTPFPPHFMLEGAIQTSYLNPQSMSYGIKVVRNSAIEQNYIFTDCFGGTTNSFHSGFTFCRDSIGTVTIKGWGIFQGM